MQTSVLTRPTLSSSLARDFGLEPAMFAGGFRCQPPVRAASIVGATSIPQLELALRAAEVEWTAEMQGTVGAIHQRTGNPCP